jgi:hypothetical protein
VSTSIGGSGVSGADGSFSFPLDVPPNAVSVNVTAMASLVGVSYAATAQSVPVLVGGLTDAGVLVLRPSSQCNPSWIPTFGQTAGVASAVPFTPVGVYSMTTFDDGSGPALYAGGPFASAGGGPANNIAKWNGSRWSPVESGVSGSVFALTAFDDGSGGGPALYVGGNFTFASGVPANGIAKWSGTSWSAVGSGIGSTSALTVFDDGNGGGPALYAAGGGGTVARWDGTTWSSLGGGMNHSVYALAVFDDGTGGALYAGGPFTSAGGVTANRIARWSGASWSPLGSGMNNAVSALAVFDDGSGGRPALYAGGLFTTAGGVSANKIAKWDGTSWSPLGSGAGAGVASLTVFDDESGSRPVLCVGGDFEIAGGGVVNFIAGWNGSTWSPLGKPWDGFHSTEGLIIDVNALTTFDDRLGGGPALYAGGNFTLAGGVATNFIGKWDGTTWRALGSGVNGWVHALKVFDDGRGSGPALYAAGVFSSAGGTAAGKIAKWNGTSWSTLGSAVLNSSIVSLAVFDDGAGAALYAGGQFSAAGGVAANNIAKWNGTAWSSLGTGTNSTVYGSIVFDDRNGGGPALYVVGDFTTAGGVTANRIARWNGTSWSPLGSGMNNPVRCLTVFDDGSGGGASALRWRWLHDRWRRVCEQHREVERHDMVPRRVWNEQHRLHHDRLRRQQWQRASALCRGSLHERWRRECQQHREMERHGLVTARDWNQ